MLLPVWLCIWSGKRWPRAWLWRECVSGCLLATSQQLCLQRKNVSSCPLKILKRPHFMVFASTYSNIYIQICVCVYISATGKWTLSRITTKQWHHITNQLAFVVFSVVSSWSYWICLQLFCCSTSQIWLTIRWVGRKALTSCSVLGPSPACYSPQSLLPAGGFYLQAIRAQLLGEGHSTMSLSGLPLAGKLHFTVPPAAHHQLALGWWAERHCQALSRGFLEPEHCAFPIRRLKLQKGRGGKWIELSTKYFKSHV